LFYGLVVGLDLISTFIIAGIAVSVLSSILLVGPLVYWLIGRGFSASRVVGGATFLASLLAIPGLLAVALLVLAVFRVASLSSLAYLAVILLVLFIAQYLVAPYLVLYTSKARRPGAGEEWVVELFEEVRRSSGYKGEVELYIVDTPVPNAFAVGNVFKKAVVVHSGLLRVLDRDEVRAVLAHELGHIANRDNAYMIAVSLTPFLTYVIGLLSLLFGVGYIMGTVKGAQRTIEYAKSRGENEEEVALGAYFAVLIAIVIGLIAIMVGLLLTVASYLANIGVLAFSRVREHLADMYSVRVTGGTEIVQALEKIERAVERMVESGEAGFQPSVKKALYIIPMAYGELTGASPSSLVRLVKYIKTTGGPRRRAHQSGLIKYIMMSSPLSTHPSVEARAYVVSSYYRELASKRLYVHPKA
jgi:heat shock protein HtpX